MMKIKRFYDSPEIDVIYLNDDIITGTSAGDENPPDWDQESDG